MSVKIYHIRNTFPSGTVAIEDENGNVLSDKAGVKRIKPYDILPVNNLASHNNKFFENL